MDSEVLGFEVEAWEEDEFSWQVKQSVSSQQIMQYVFQVIFYTETTYIFQAPHLSIIFYTETENQKKKMGKKKKT